MRISEIVTNSNIDTSKWLNDDVKKDFLSNGEDVGEILQTYPVLNMKSKWGEEYGVFDNDILIGRIVVHPISLNSTKNKKIFQIVSFKVDDNFKHTELAEGIIKFLNMDLDKSLLCDWQNSPDMTKFWKKMIKKYPEKVKVLDGHELKYYDGNITSNDNIKTSDGQIVLSPEEETKPDKNGEYRFFWIMETFDYPLKHDLSNYDTLEMRIKHPELYRQNEFKMYIGENKTLTSLRKLNKEGVDNEQN